MGGSFQTSREIFDSPIWKNIVDFRLFFLIYGQAVFANEGVRLADDLVLQRGEWCRSLRNLQKDLEYVENRQVKTYSLSVLNRCIKRAVDLQRLCTRTHELGTVFTVVNYELYQGFGGFKKENLERNLEHSGNSGGTLGEHSGNNNKNVKKEKNANKEKITKVHYAEFVSLTEIEFEKLKSEYGEVFSRRCVSTLDNYKGASGKKYTSDYRAILNWVVDRVKEDEKKLTVVNGGGNGAKHGRGYAGNAGTYKPDEDELNELYYGSPKPGA